jgi:hypothetical protein
METWHLIALTLSVVIVLYGLVRILRLQTPEGRLPPRVVAISALAWVISIPFIWGVAGWVAGEPLGQSAAIPAKAVIKALPYFLKAL